MSKITKTKSAAMRSFHVSPRSTPKGIIKARKLIFGSNKVKAVKLPAGAPYPVAGVTERCGTTLLQANALALAAQLEKELGGNEALDFFRKVRQNSEMRTNHVSEKGCRCNHKPIMVGGGQAETPAERVARGMSAEPLPLSPLERLRAHEQMQAEAAYRLKQGPENSFPPPAPLPEKPQEARVCLPDCFDAQVWAREWLKTIKDNPGIPQDEGTMISWFANAIMAGYDNARRKYDKPREAPVDLGSLNKTAGPVSVESLDRKLDDRLRAAVLPRECLKAEANDCKKSSPMLEASDGVYKVLAMLDDEIGMLAAKLQPVLGPEGPKCGSDAKCEPACNSGVTETMRNYERRVNAARMNLRDLRDRLEV